MSQGALLWGRCIAGSSQRWGPRVDTARRSSQSVPGTALRKLTLFSPLSLSTLVVGITPELNTTVSIENRGENSYSTTVRFFYPAALSYRRVLLLQVPQRTPGMRGRLCSGEPCCREWAGDLAGDAALQGAGGGLRRGHRAGGSGLGTQFGASCCREWVRAWQVVS